MSEERSKLIFAPCIDFIAGGVLAIITLVLYHCGPWRILGYVVFAAAIGALLRAFR